MATDHVAHESHASAKAYYIVFAALLVLLLVTVGVAELPVGKWGFAIAVVVATTKALLILLYFMHVKDSRPLIWLIAGAGFFWLAILFGLTVTDFATRGGQMREPNPAAQHP